ncbi:MAG: DMT family transporter [Thermoleophilia bacterium]|nr:DMT family transporter [Thermoleophilia bacterium]
MSARHLTMLGLLGAIWGAAFMLIEIGLRGFDPAALIAIRLGSAALALALFEAVRGRLRSTLVRLRPYARRLALAGLVNTAVPFFLIAWGQQYVDSNVAAILNAAAPLFTVLLAAAAVRSERVTGLRLAGFVVGFAGVVLVVGVSPEDGRRGLLGALAIVAATGFYAAGALYVSRRLRGISPLDVSFGLLSWAAMFTLPGLMLLRGSEAGWGPVMATLALGVVATALAFQLYFGLIAGLGAARAILVTYLVPALALVYGVTLLDERLRWSAVAGLALVLAGVAVGTGAVRRRVAAPA